MRQLLTLVLSVQLVVVLGCDGDPQPARDGGRDGGRMQTGDAGMDGGPIPLPPQQCGSACGAEAPFYPPGFDPDTTCYDGCNWCLCTSDGLLNCTARACPPDAGAGDASPADAAAVTDGRADAQDAASTDAAQDAASTDAAAAADAARADAAPADAGQVVCGAGGGESFPGFDRACGAAEDCAVVEHQIDCCGTIDALGIAAAEVGAFDSAEATCRSMYPSCGCAARPTTADDGSVGDGSAARVECVEGTCTSTFGLEDGEVCEPGADECGPASSCCYPCGVPGCQHRCEPTCDATDPACVDGCLLRA